MLVSVSYFVPNESWQLVFKDRTPKNGLKVNTGEWLLSTGNLTIGQLAGLCHQGNLDVEGLGFFSLATQIPRIESTYLLHGEL